MLKGNDVVLHVTDGADEPVDVTGVKAVTALTMPGQKPIQARFKMGHGH